MLRLAQRRRSGNAIARWRAASFWAGWLAVVLALVSPLHWLGERLFVAHMMEHEVLMIVGAPLIAMSRPIATILWALPSGARKRIEVWSKNHMIARGWSALTDPFVATALHGFALWSWHMPILYDLVL